MSDLITVNNNKNINGENASAMETWFSRKNKGCSSIPHQSLLLVPMEIIQKETERRDREKERRKKVADKFSVLQSLVPNLPNKIPRAEIMEETIKCIKNLEGRLKELEESKKKRKESSETSRISLNSTTNGSIVDVTVSGKAAFFGIQVEINNVEEPFLFSKVMKVFEQYKAEILNATISTTNGMKKIITVSVLINEEAGGEGSIEEIKKGINRLFV
ncbi:hypothetical protein MKW94_015209 [Papaver nudicaule]|uniref:BHLH domain-containing protein n=1 Tax=Papaver nudicaule TaxID=74823 RepID=A0AA41UYZ0_PAPNU|nr:hypothetical protein [Papaver nudicaule]